MAVGVVAASTSLVLVLEGRLRLLLVGGLHMVSGYLGLCFITTMPFWNCGMGSTEPARGGGAWCGESSISLLWYCQRKIFVKRNSIELQKIKNVFQGTLYLPR
jgi:hypothetical protein